MTIKATSDGMMAIGEAAKAVGVGFDRDELRARAGPTRGARMSFDRGNGNGGTRLLAALVALLGFTQTARAQ